MKEILRFDAVEKRYGDTRVLRGASFTLRPGELVGLIGPNGAGKTTLMRIAAGLVRQDAGSVVLGADVYDGHSHVRSIRYFAGEMTLPAGASARKWASVLAPTHEVSESRRLGVLSRGSRQLVGLRAHLAPPFEALYVLDEPWEGLDPHGAGWLSESLQRLRNDGAAILVSSHRLFDLAEVCDRYVFLVNGILHELDTLAIDGRATRDALLDYFDQLRRTTK